MRKHLSVGVVFVVASLLVGCNSLNSLRSETYRSPISAAEEFSIPPELAMKCILVPVRFQDEEHLFVLDTGTTGVIFDEVFRNDLGKSISHSKMWTPAGYKDIEFFEPPDASWGSVDLKIGGKVGCLDLSIFRSLLGYDIKGIIGMTVLARLVVQIDFLNSKVIIMPPDGQQHPEWGQSVALGFDRRWAPTVRASCPPADEIVMMVDSGSTSNGCLASVDVQRLGESVQSVEEDYHVSTLGKMTQVRTQLRLPEFKLGSLIYSDMIFHEDNYSSLGLGFLSRHLVTFDFPHRRLYLKQVDNPNHGKRFHISGLILKKKSDRIVVCAVIPGSPAEKAGMQVGDAILQIGDEDTHAMEMWQAARLLISVQQKEIQLLIEREGEIIRLSLVLQQGL